MTKPASGSFRPSSRTQEAADRIKRADNTLGVAVLSDDRQILQVHAGNPNQDNDWLSVKTVENLVKAEIGEQVFELWFANECEIRVTPEAIIFVASNKFTLQRLQSSFGVSIRRVVERLSSAGKPLQLGYLTDESLNEGDPKDQLDSTPDHSDRPSEVTSVAPVVAATVPSRRPQKGPALSSFCFGSENVLAKASVDQVMNELGQFSPVLFYGPCGSGKSHLLSAITREARMRMPGKRCVYLSAEQFTTLFLQSLRGTGLPMFRRKYRDLDVLAIDDVQFFAGKKATLNEFQHTIDNLMRAGKQIIISADRPPAELSCLGQDITTRLTAGLIAPLRFPEFEGRVRIARRLCKERDFSIPAAPLEHVCRRLSGDVRLLSGALNRLHLAQVASG